MDIEKLIERLRSYTYWLGQDGPESHDIHPLICDEAADAISTIPTLQAENEKLIAANNAVARDNAQLQAENAKLRTELEKESAARKKQADLLCELRGQKYKQMSVIDRLRSELNDLRAQWDMYGGDVGITATFAELEQVKQKLSEAEKCIEIIEKQRDAAIKQIEKYMVQEVLDGNEPCDICAKANTIPCEGCDPKWRDPEER